MKTFPENSDISKLNRVKFGIDPTSDKLHLGHLVPLRQFKKLKDQGKDCTIVLGTFTAQLGDPSGKEKTRPMLSCEDTESNANSILSQVERVVGSGFKVFRNGDLFNVMSVSHLLNICSQFTVNNMLSRDAFQKRIEVSESISLHELMVPICQGLDSVHLDSDIEIGGTDQLFNFQVSRKLQSLKGQDPEVCILCPIINGTDGRKMSKSLGNCIFLNDDPKNIFGKCMSVSDDTMDEWIPLLTDLNITDLNPHPMKRKKQMSFDIVKQVCGLEKANEVLSKFENVVQKNELPTDIPKINETNILNVITIIRNCSRTEGRKLLKNSVKVNDIKVNDEKLELSNNDIIKVGKRHFGLIDKK